jgi:lysylphosphatidylglycerol synthetase-like protein (DUF2156 family)
MKSYIRSSLLIVSAVFAIYGLGFIFFPQEVHNLLSTGTYDPATASLVAASLLGLSLVLLIEAQDPNRERVYGLAAALGILGIAIILGILNNGGIKANGATLFSLIITFGTSIYLFIVQSEAASASVGSAVSSSAPAPKAKAVKKKSKTPAKKAKPAKKKTSKKKAKKKAKKRR